MIGYKLGETRLVQERTSTSAANADDLLIGYPGCPEGKLWVITAVGYQPSVAETQTISFQKYNSKTSSTFSLLNPVSLALNPARASFIEQGMEYMLLPGEYLAVHRGNHTAGSTMSAVIQVIEIDQPLYTYDDPITLKRQERAVSSIRTQLGGGLGAGSRTSAPTFTGERGGRGGPLEK